MLADAVFLADTTVSPHFCPMLSFIRLIVCDLFAFHIAASDSSHPSYA